MGEGVTIEIRAPDGPAEAYLTGDEKSPGVLFYVDAIGLRPRIEEMADRIAAWGYVVLAPHVFYRDGTAAGLAPGDLRETGAREAFFGGGVMKRVRALSPDRVAADAAVWLDTLRRHARPERVGLTGYCMGARLVVRTAAQFPDVVAAAGGFHGGGLVTDDVDSPHRVLEQARAEFAFGHADRDRSMPPDAVAALELVLSATGRPYRNEVYADAAHGYTMADTSTYDEAATERHFDVLEDLFARRLATD